jgi:hypothetical protein
MKDIQVEIGNRRPVQSIDTDQGRAENHVILCKQIVPNLTVSIDGPATIDSDVGAAPEPEAGGVLEDKIEAIGLPVGGVVGEQDRALDVCTTN